jgi:hypothetical protein
MTPVEYLQSLIKGMEMESGIPVQLSELKFLMALIEEKTE